MKVKATAPGFYGQLRLPDTDSAEFEVPDGSKASWFAPVETTTVETPKGKPGKNKVEGNKEDPLV